MSFFGFGEMFADKLPVNTGGLAEAERWGKPVWVVRVGFGEEVKFVVLADDFEGI